MNIKLISISFILLTLNFSTNAAAEQIVPSLCKSENVKLQMLGTRGPEFLDGNASTGYLIWINEKARIIIDAGAGSLQRFKQSGANFEDVDLMLLTHFHVDHTADFASYIKGGFFTERSKDLTVMGPEASRYSASTKQFVDRAVGKENGTYPYLGDFLDPDGDSSYKIKVITVPWTYDDLSVKQIYQQNGITVKSVSTHHGPFPSIAYRVETQGCSITFSGDMSGRLDALPELAQNTDILVAHNAIPEDATGVAERLHMKPSYISRTARAAKVKTLLLTHIMKRSLDVKPQSLELIKKEYKGKVIYPNDLDVFNP